MTTGFVQVQNQTRVFLSYSRSDEEFICRLADALHASGYLVDFDQAKIGPAEVDLGISAQDRWWMRLKEMIAAADVMVFTVSPESARSRVCDDEIAHASNLGKRIIPILRRPIDFDRAPERLRSLNVKLSFERDDEAAFGIAVEQLRLELGLDIDWHRRAARLARLAQQWDAEGRPEGQLLRTAAIADAEAWAARRPAAASPPGPLVLAFLSGSRKKEEQDRARLEISELNARVQAGDALFERALVHLQLAERHRAVECLLQATEIASPVSMPERFLPSFRQEGWARKAWTAAACLSAGLPERIAAYESRNSFFVSQCIWFDGGRHVLLIGGEHADALCVDSGSAQTVWSQKLETKIGAAAGAGSKARFAVLDEHGRLTCVDLFSGSEQRTKIELQPRREGDDLASAVGLSRLGDAIVIARAVRENQAIAEILEWGDSLSAIQTSVSIDNEHGGIQWAGFTAEGTRFGALCGGALHVFDRQGRAVDTLAGSVWHSSCVAPDFSSFATPQYDLVQLFRAPDTRSRNKDSRVPEPMVLEGAGSTIMDATFLGDGATVLALEAGGRITEWRPTAEDERGLSFGDVRITQSFGVTNRLAPSSRLEGLPKARALASHPSAPDDVLVLGAPGFEHWRLVDPTKPLETLPFLGPCARVIASAASGMIAAATEGGVWTRALNDRGGQGRMIGPPGVVWDVAIEANQLAATCPDRCVRIWSLRDGQELHTVDVEAVPLSVLFSHGASRLFIGLANGVLWEWSEREGLVRIAALGVGPIRRLRMSADQMVGVAAGKTSDNDDDIDRMHGGVAAWSPLERRLIWTTDRFVLDPHDVDISPDGRVIFVAGRHQLVALDAKTPAVLSRMRPPQTDASKPDHATAICAGPDGRTAFIGLWDGSLVHADPLTERVITTIKAHAKYIASIACDYDRGIILTSSPVPEGNPVAIWRGWNPEFFSRRADAERIAYVRRTFAARYSSRMSESEDDHERGEEASLKVIWANPDDPVTEGRCAQEYDDARAADLFAQAALAGRASELSPEEQALAGEVLLARATAEALPLLQQAARAGSTKADMIIGRHFLGEHPRSSDWESALPHFRRAAERGDAHAAFLVGYYYDRFVRGAVGAVDWRAIAAPSGVGPAVDDPAETACIWYKRAAAAGSERASARLAELTKRR